MIYACIWLWTYVCFYSHAQVYNNIRLFYTNTSYLDWFMHVYFDLSHVYNDLYIAKLTYTYFLNTWPMHSCVYNDLCILIRKCTFNLTYAMSIHIFTNSCQIFPQHVCSNSDLCMSVSTYAYLRWPSSYTFIYACLYPCMSIIILTYLYLCWPMHVNINPCKFKEICNAYLYWLVK